AIDVSAFPRGRVPDGFVYVPAGDSLFGEADESLRVSFLDTVPIAATHVGAFLIARDETTYAQWIEFLEDVPPAERALRAPAVRAPQGGAVTLRRLAPRVWELTLEPTTRALVARTGELVTYPDRTLRKSQDWRRFPVTVVSAADADAYMTWLRRTGRLAGA